MSYLSGVFTGGVGKRSNVDLITSSGVLSSPFVAGCGSIGWCPRVSMMSWTATQGECQIQCNRHTLREAPGTSLKGVSTPTA